MPLLLFAPGAGASSAHPWMRRWAGLLAPVGTVTTFDYDYIKAGNRRPDPLPQLIAAHARVLADVSTVSDKPVVLVGKSMGSRVGCHVSLQRRVDALICFGYPLCGGGDRSKVRDKVLRELTTPILFLQGTRDPLCPLDLLEETRASMRAMSDLYVVEGGDHSLNVSKRQLTASNESQTEVDSRIVWAISQFIARHVPRQRG